MNTMEPLKKYLFVVSHLNGRLTSLQFEGIFLETVGQHHLIADYATQKFKILQEGEFKFSTPEEPNGFEEYNFQEHEEVMTQVTVKALELMDITAVNLPLDDYLGVIEQKIKENSDRHIIDFLTFFLEKIKLNPFIKKMKDTYPGLSIDDIYPQLEANHDEESAGVMREVERLYDDLLRTLATLPYEPGAGGLAAGSGGLAAGSGAAGSGGLAAGSGAAGSGAAGSGAAGKGGDY